MPAHSSNGNYSPFAFQISSVSHPKTLEDLNSFHKDSLYELVSATRQAYLMKAIANKLASTTKSSNARDMANLIADSAREQERSLRMASCIANAPVSTAYPYLPVMPTKLSASAASTTDTKSSPSPSIAAPLPTPMKQSVGGMTTLGVMTKSAFPITHRVYPHRWNQFI